MQAVFVAVSLAGVRHAALITVLYKADLDGPIIRIAITVTVFLTVVRVPITIPVGRDVAYRYPIIAVDYLQLVRPSDAASGRTEQLDAIMADLAAIAQAAMRHSTIDLTMNTYTDLRLLYVAGAVNSVPDIPLDAPPSTDRQTATGTDDVAALCAALALDADQTCQFEATAGNPTMRDILATLGVTCDGDGLSDAPDDGSGKRANGLEP